MEFPRPIYLERLKVRKHNGLIKIITGIHRAGKSCLLNTLFYNDLIKSSIDKNHIIKFSFDSYDDKALLKPFCPDEPLYIIDNHKQEKVNADKFCSYIATRITGEDDYYLLLDEVQLLDRFESVLNGYLSLHNLDIYVTGSNSKFLSKDVITEFKGRGDQIHILPLSFSKYTQGFKQDLDTSWNDYIVYGGIPQVVLMTTDKEKTTYLKNLCENLYISDIVERYHLKNDSDISDIFNIIASSIGSLVNPPKLSKTFLSVKNTSITNDTIIHYIDELMDSFLISKALRYDVKGKHYISTDMISLK